MDFFECYRLIINVSDVKFKDYDVLEEVDSGNDSNNHEDVSMNDD